MTISYEEYESIISIDTNIILECQPLDQLKWQEIGTANSILIIVAPQVAREVDKRKRDSRLNQRAKDFNRILAKFIAEDAPVRISNKKIKVDIAMFNVGRIEWAEFDLDPEEGDQKIIGQLLHVPNLAPSRITFVGHDIGSLAIAKSKGLPIYHIPDYWLAGPEMNPHEKESKKLKAQVELLSAAEPSIEASLDIAPSGRLTIWDIAGPSEAEVRHLVASSELVRRGEGGPFPQSFSLISYNEPSNEDIDSYNSRLKVIASQLNQKLMNLVNQFKIHLTIENQGPMTARGMELTISTSGAKTHDKCLVSNGWPPAKPTSHLERVGISKNLIQVGAPRLHPEDEFSDKDAGHLVSARRISCADFRQERRDVITLFGIGNEAFGEIEILCRMSFANKRGVSVVSRKVAVDRRSIPFGEAYDVETDRYLIRPAIMEDIERFLEPPMQKNVRYYDDQI